MEEKLVWTNFHIWSTQMNWWKELRSLKKTWVESFVGEEVFIGMLRFLFDFMLDIDMHFRAI